MGRFENVFISRNRIYGISGDYTFFTPIFHSILASIAFMVAFFTNRKKYYFYIPFLLIMVLLNGRFGLLIFFCCLTISFIYSAIVRKNIFKIFGTIIMISLVVTVLIYFVKLNVPYTYQWIMGGVEDTVKLLIYGELSGNFSVLGERYLFFPTGISILIGEGHRVYGEYATQNGFSHSDIGFVNDLFMGGVIYVSILYGSIARYVLQTTNSEFIGKHFQIVINISLILSLLLANYKGETMRGGLVLLGVLMFKMIMDLPDKKENPIS
ncbi:hypothetical protein EVJ29_06865 [Exiguobacterium sp. SH4S7]|nr:hypothetical protein EVJ29_06865 [Exiguobacterium sp. SH4S7]